MGGPIRHDFTSESHGPAGYDAGRGRYAGMAKIIVTGNDQRREYELGAINTIGRHPDNTLQILDRIVSKEHAQVVRQPDGRYVYRDLGSLNGSFVRGERVSEHVLHEGDEITLGSTTLTFEERSAQDRLLQKVTIAPSMTEALIRQRIEAPSTKIEFLPEREIADVEVLRRDYEKLRLAHELGRSIGLEVNLELLLERIIMKAFELIPADRGVILLMEDGVPTPKVAKTRDGKNEQIVLSKSILSEVVTNKASVLSSDATMDSRFSAAHSVIMQGIRSTMTVPLIHHDELLGIMHLDSMIATNAFTDKDLQIFGGIASQAAIAIHNSELARKIEHEAKTRAQFQRLLSPNLVDQVVQGKLQLEKGGALSEVTLLFSDIRGFTSMSESRQPQEIVRMLNEYFELMVDVVFKYEGTLDKFVGDEVIALFGAPVAMRNAELKAVQCALDMMRVLSEFNRTRTAEGQNEITIGIGINTGTVVTGAIGSSRALQYTAIGDAVNTASRLCSVAQAGQIILSEATYRKVQADVAAAPLPPVRVKGKAEALRVYNAVGLHKRDERAETTRPA
jgi:adenylate cyclase